MIQKSIKKEDKITGKKETCFYLKAIAKEEREFEIFQYSLIKERNWGSSEAEVEQKIKQIAAIRKIDALKGRINLYFYYNDEGVMC